MTASNADDTFGFTVKAAGQEGCQAAADNDWGLWLPHQCDDWLIAAGPNRAEVLTAARDFRTQLDHAIAAIEAGKPLNYDDPAAW